MPSQLASPILRAPLVGRTSELHALQQHLDLAATGDPQVVILSGEAGLGKSRLITAFAESVTGRARVIVGRCFELGDEGPSYAALRAMLRSVIADLGVSRLATAAGPHQAQLALLAPELARGRVIVDPVADPLGRGRLFEAIADMVEAGCASTPLVLVFEDLNWADAATLDLVDFLVRAATAIPVMFVLTYRREDLPDGHLLHRRLSALDRAVGTHRIALQPLSDSEIGEVVAHVAGDIPEGMREVGVARAQGIPLFAEELAASCRTDLAVIPDSLRDLLLARLSQLDDTARHLVSVAAIATGPVPHRTLAEVAGLPEAELERGLHQAIERHVLVVDAARGGYDVGHALMREALRDLVLPGTAAGIHASYARALSQTGEPGEVAHHWAAAWQPEPALVWSVRAAAHSRATYAWAQELAQLEVALQLWDTVPDAAVAAGHSHTAILARAAQAAADAGAPQRALDLLDSAIAESATTTESEAIRQPGADPVDLLLLRARVLGALGRADEADLQRARDLAPPGSVGRATALALMATQLEQQGSPQEALAAADTALVAAREAGDDRLAGHVHATLGTAHCDVGEHEAGLAHLRMARDLALASRDWAGLMGYYINASEVLIGSGDYPGALDLASQGRATAAGHGLARTLGTLLAGNEAEALVHAGRWDEATATVGLALRAEPPPPTRAHLYLQRGQVRFRRGQRQGCEDDLRSARVLLAGVTQPQRTLPAASLSAALAATTGEHIPALRILEHALPDRPNHLPTGPAAWPFAWVWARVLAGALAKAAIDPRWGWAQMLRIDALVRHLGRVSNHPGWPALVAADLARVHDLMRPARSGSQLGSWRVAVSALSGVPGLRYEWAYAQLRLAEALLAHGERRAARLALTSSGAAIDELGAAALAPTARRIAAAGRVTLRPASSRPEVLTPREREVLALVAAGHTNAEISRALVIAAKTTSVHVSSILAKLGVSSRTQAAAWAHAHPEEMGTRD